MPSSILETLQYYNQRINKIVGLLKTQPVDADILISKVEKLLHTESEDQSCWMVYDHFLTFLKYKLSDYPFLIDKIDQVKLEHYKAVANNQDALQQQFKSDSEQLLKQEIHPQVRIQLIFYYKKVLKPEAFHTISKNFVTPQVCGE